MKLTYHQSKNFGDALNPFIFKQLLPNFFNQNSKILFLGIGSILGLKRPNSNTKKLIVFSSGCGGQDSDTYGSLPSKKIREIYDIRCVRGPLTAKLLNLPEKYSICDGAILLTEVTKHIERYNKEYEYSYMPHIGTLDYYNGWEELLNSIDINFINPTDDIDFIIKEIKNSKILLTEAMHGAIVADTLRTPWLPIISKKSINKFKWKDFCLSLDMDYLPNYVDTLYTHDFLNGIVSKKINMNNHVTNLLSKSYLAYQSLYVERKVLDKFKKIKKIEPQLSEISLLNSKKDQLLTKLNKIQEDYS